MQPDTRGTVEALEDIFNDIANPDYSST